MEGPSKPNNFRASFFKTLITPRLLKLKSPTKSDLRRIRETQSRWPTLKRCFKSMTKIRRPPTRSKSRRKKCLRRGNSKKSRFTSRQKKIKIKRLSTRTLTKSKSRRSHPLALAPKRPASRRSRRSYLAWLARRSSRQWEQGKGWMSNGHQFIYLSWERKDQQ